MNEIGIMSETGDERPILSPAEAIDAEAVAWFVKRLNRDESREWTDAVETEFDAWLAQSPKHRIAYWRAESGWDHVQLLTAVRPPSDLRDRTGIHHSMRDRTRDWSLWFKRAGAIAAVLAVVAVAAFQFVGRQAMTYSTPVGGHEILTLADGSRVELNTDTVVRVANTTGRERAVELVQGEAFFEVKHDATHPFVVTAGGERLVDLGTEFVIRKDADRTRVGLVAGSVRVETSGFWSHATLATLEPGDLAVAMADKISITRGAAREVSDDLAWRTGQLIFRRATLGDAAAEFNRYNEEKLVVADAQTATLRFSSAFPVHGMEAFARVVQRLLSLHVEHREGEIVISR